MGAGGIVAGIHTERLVRRHSLVIMTIVDDQVGSRDDDQVEPLTQSKATSINLNLTSSSEPTGKLELQPATNTH
jgi:hypothetical protein